MCSQIYENSKKNLNLILRAGKQKVKSNIQSHRVNMKSLIFLNKNQKLKIQLKTHLHNKIQYNKNFKLSSFCRQLKLRQNCFLKEASEHLQDNCNDIFNEAQKLSLILICTGTDLTKLINISVSDDTQRCTILMLPSRIKPQRFISVLTYPPPQISLS